MRKALAALMLTTSLIIATITAAPAHADARHTTVAVSTKADRSGYTINVTAEHRATGKPMHGKARLYLNGDHLRTRELSSRGGISYTINRSRLPDGKRSRIVVKIDPWRDGLHGRSITRYYTDSYRPAAARALGIARAKIGSRYVFGAAGPHAFDCSGLVKYAYRTTHNLPHSSAAQSRIGTRVSSPKPGDLVYTPGHISIYAGNGRVIEAANPSTGVRITKMWQRGAIYIRV